MDRKFVNAKLAKLSLILIFNKIKSLNGASLDCNIDKRDIEIAQSIGINLKKIKTKIKKDKNGKITKHKKFGKNIP